MTDCLQRPRGTTNNLRNDNIGIGQFRTYPSLAMNVEHIGQSPQTDPGVLTQGWIECHCDLRRFVRLKTFCVCRHETYPFAEPILDSPSSGPAKNPGCPTAQHHNPSICASM
jgi:hypothetical protein